MQFQFQIHTTYVFGFFQSKSLPNAELKDAKNVAVKLDKRFPFQIDFL